MGHAADLFIPIIKILMIALRAGSLWMFFPIFAQSTIPRPVRLAGALTFSVALLPSVGSKLPMWSMAAPPGSGEMLAFTARELLIGAGMGLVARWLFAAVMSSAQWVGMQMGFSAGGLVDPEFNAGDSSWAEFHNWVAIMIFFSIGGHLMLIRAIADSYAFNFSDFGTRLMDPQLGAQFWSEIGSRFFVWMLKLAGPIVTVLLLLQAALGILSKFIPQINIWSVSIPITIGAGVMVLILLSPLYGDAISSLFTTGNETNYMWLRAMGTR